MKKNYNLFTLGIAMIAINSMDAQCPAPTSVTAIPNIICAGATTSLNATSAGAAINWYTVAVGGTPLGSSPSGVNFTINPSTTITYYAETFLAAAVNFSYTGSMQTYTVPTGVTQLTIDVKGAQGGGIASVPGGLGGRLQSVLTVTPGQVLNIFVGGQGNPIGTAGFNGGGTGIGGSATNPGGGGGGATDIRVGGIALVNRILVAGGGGGSTDNGGNSNGGAGGGLIGANGIVGTNPWNCTNTTVATGGSQAAGGLGGTSISCAWNGFNGSLGLGGNSYTLYRSGGGGGGYYGGGGAHNGMSGAGGSSYAIPTASSVIHTQGSQVGDGLVTITYPSCFSATRIAVSVTVNPNPVIIVNSGTICTGNSFTISPSGANSYTIQGGNAVVSPTANTSYTVVGTSTAGCISQTPATSSVTVNASPLPTITVNSGAVCAGNSFTMIANGASTYTFSSGSAIVTPTATTSYSVIGTNSLGCNGVASAISNVTVNALPTVTAVSNASLICIGETASLTASGANTYTWNTSATTTAVIVSPSVTTSYTVTGASANGCTNAIAITQSVSACTGINANQLSNVLVSVYPNPNNGEFTISSDSEMNLSIVNNLGQVVKVISINESNNYKASVSNLANGIYFVVGQNNNQIISTKIVVSK